MGFECIDERLQSWEENNRPPEGGLCWAIIQALSQAQYMYEQIGDFNTEEYLEMVNPLHQALLRIASTDQEAVRPGDGIR